VTIPTTPSVVHRVRWTSSAARVAVCCSALLCSGCGGSNEPGAAGPELIFGRTGAGPGEFNYPRAAAFSPDVRLYVVDKGGRVQCLDADGAFLLDWKLPAIEQGKPTGIGIGPDGRVFLADTHYGRVLIYDRAGHLVYTLGEPGTGPGQFLLPTDVAIDADGTIYVSEYGGNDRISKFAPDYRFLLDSGGKSAGPGKLERPQSIWIAPDHTFWVADACNHRICRFSPDGDFLGAFGRAGSAPGELRFPYNIAMLSDGTLVVAEYGNNRVQRFTVYGESLGTWGTAGRHPGQLAYPWALAVAPDDRVFVVDSGSNRVQVIDGASSRTWR
jgi:DNA-binding beta-propeller fold protein YncE